MKHYRNRGEGKRESTDNNINNGKEKSVKYIYKDLEKQFLNVLGPLFNLGVEILWDYMLQEQFSPDVLMCILFL